MSLKPDRPTLKRGIGAGSHTTNTAISVCGQCEKTVWSWEPHVWSTGRWTLGWVHTECEEAA